MKRGTVLIRMAVTLTLLATCCGCMMIDLSSLAMTPELKEATIDKAPGWFVSEKILVVDISGFISREKSDGILSSEKTVTPEYARSVFNKAIADLNIRGVILRVDSPGGCVVATELITQEVLRFKRARPGVPVDAHITGVGASGSYHIACAADRISAQPSAIVGSIGVIMALPQMRGLADKIGYDQVVIKSGEMKDIGNPLREMTEEERDVLQGLIDSSYGQFLDHIVARRKTYNSVKDVKPVADGRIFSASDAKAKGLIDGVSDLDTVVAAMRKKVAAKGAHVVTYGYRRHADPNIYSRLDSADARSLFGERLPVQSTMLKTGFYYLWAPGL